MKIVSLVDIVSISGDGGKSVSFTEETYKALAPKLDFGYCGMIILAKFPI